MVKIIADTTSGLPGELLASLGIVQIPQIVIFGEKSFRDDTELDTATFLAKLRSSRQLPKTAAPPPNLYFPHFEDAMKSKEEVIVIAPSAKVSGTVNSAEVAAKDFPHLKIHVVDSQTVAGNLATLVLLAHQWASEGNNAEDIVQRLGKWIPRSRTYFLVDTLEYLQKGGRIGGAKALLGELLQVKPILRLGEGQVQPFEQQRTKKRAINRLIEVVEQECPKGNDSHICLLQADANAEANELAVVFKTKLEVKAIPIYEMPPAIVVHGGPGILGVAFFAAETPMV
jgi:DegV family protein with EDD domain